MKGTKTIPVEALTSWEIGGLHLRIVGKPLSKEEFSFLRKKGFIYDLFGEFAAESELPEGWYIDKQKLDEMEKHGFTVDDEIKKLVDKYFDDRRRSNEMRQIAEQFDLRCPRCNEKLVVGQWSPERAILRCYMHKYTAVVNRNGVIDQGFDDEKRKEYGDVLFWEKAVFNHGSVEKAKKAIMEERRSVGVCMICGKRLDTWGDVIEHLQKVHGTD